MASTEHISLQQTLFALQQFFERYAAPQYLVGVSGGRDSMLLCDLLLQLKLPIALLHVNYKLRGSESDQDQEFIASYCRQHNLKLHCLEIDLKAQLQEKKSNLQAEARAVRYRFFREIQNQYPASLLCVAHHQDDQIETFWLQLARGAGLKGLAGMPEHNKGLLRPLLTLNGAQMTALCAALGTKYRNDSSNSNLKYRRNLWRHKLLPFLNAAVPALKTAVPLLQKQLQREIENQKEALELAICRFQKNRTITLNDISQLNVFQYIELFKNVGVPLHVIKRIGDLFFAENGKFLSWKTTNQKHKCYLVKQSQHLVYYDAHPSNWKFEFRPASVEELQDGPLINTALIKGKPFLRLALPGDKIRVKGLKGSKSVFQVFKEAGIPAPLRPLQMVLCDSEKILAIPEVQINFLIQASPNTAHLAKLEFEKILNFEHD